MGSRVYYHTRDDYKYACLEPSLMTDRRRSGLEAGMLPKACFPMTTKHVVEEKKRTCM